MRSSSQTLFPIRRTIMTKQRISMEICLAAILLPIGSIVCFCLFFGHPSEYAWLPSCPFRVWTGLCCPGCGTLRATHYFLNGQFDIAFHCQPLLFSLLPILALLVGKVFYENMRNTSVKLPFELQIHWLILVAVCLFFVLRNIPFDCLECLRPPRTEELTFSAPSFNTPQTTVERK